ncbi:SAM-dependent methyltransferase [Cyanobium sp. WAJ14-Wanaka]|uniref:SAM-dependent methyltransferase n=1 Tax=Cyanobium sp. WAJ14-Wanaka TaxID=2823725 RepID=UPI0020CE71DA|nr:SAM-dependent methyltransferase [Cyanobium sp. WAJ14-Wanaka]MCP9775245.1 SAM-dependent methyltransferase [Cyanobium sp. WAJ14-Wanaka]
MSSPTLAGKSFGEQVRRRFGGQAPSYNQHALLQQAIAWRLAHHCRRLQIPQGARADLGAGTGLVGQAMAAQGISDPYSPLLQIDLCPELLARNPLATPPNHLIWDLNNGLPPQLPQAALLTSSFALQWLEDPRSQLDHWCGRLQPAGWLALAVPTAGSFPEWRQAADQAGVACTALELPAAEGLIQAAANHLELKTCQQLWLGRRHGSGSQFLSQLQQLGASASRQPGLGAEAMRRLLRHWPRDGTIHWQVLLLLGQRKEQ